MTQSKTTHNHPKEHQAAEAEAAADAQDQASFVDQAIAEAAALEIPASDDQQALVQKLQAALTSAEDQALRAHAELENYRKRASRHLEVEKKYAPLPLLRDLLPVLDNLERAIQSSEQDGGAAGLLEGVKMVAQLLIAVLERHHWRRIEARGAAFDPHVHEAIAQFPCEKANPGTVIEVALPGYQLYDRVVRPAQVLVATRTPTGRAVVPEASSNNKDLEAPEAKE